MSIMKKGDVVFITTTVQGREGWPCEVLSSRGDQVELDDVASGEIMYFNKKDLLGYAKVCMIVTKACT